MPDRQLSYGVDIKDNATATGKQIARNFKQSMKSVQGDLDDTGSEASKLAKVVGKMADDINQKLDNVEAIARQLGDSMPDEDARRFAAALDAAGVSSDQLGDDTGELIAQMRRLEEAGERAGMGVKKGTDQASDGVKHLGHESDQSRSVLANMAGNTTQELGELGGVAGSAGVAIGQMAEYAADGNINLKSLVGLVGGLGLVAAVSGGIAGALKKVAESKAFDRDRVNDFRRALVSSGDAAEVLVSELEDTGKIMVEIGEFGRFDIVPALAELGLTVEQFTDLAGRSEEEIVAWADALRAAGVDTAAVDAVLVGAIDTHGNLVDAEKAAAVSNAVLGDSMDDTTESTEDQNRALQENVDRLRERIDAAVSARDNELNLADAMLATADQLDDYNATMADAEATERDRIQAGIDLEQQFYNEADAAGEWASAQAIAAGNAEDAQEASVTAQIATLKRLLGNLDANSPLRDGINQHIDALRRIPTHIDTEVNVRTSFFERVAGLASKIPGRASGGPVSRGGLYEVFDTQSPELLEQGGKTFLLPGADGRVTPMTATGGSRGGQPPTINVNVTAGFGADGDDIANKIVDVLTRWQRNNGPLPWAPS